eukprot:1159492-Alexandrium_andersonii.AAC.1
MAQGRGVASCRSRPEPATVVQADQGGGVASVVAGPLQQLRGLREVGRQAGRLPRRGAKPALVEQRAPALAARFEARDLLGGPDGRKG